MCIRDRYSINEVSNSIDYANETVILTCQKTYSINEVSNNLDYSKETSTLICQKLY